MPVPSERLTDAGVSAGADTTHGTDANDAAATWDDFYLGDGDDAPHWSGRPNPSLVTEVATLRPGRVLDVGCGEGADAIWLAGQGWQVTAIDPSSVALRRGELAAAASGVTVRWIAAGLLDLPSEGTTYDLVAAHYPVLPLGDGGEAVAALLGAVARGGTLLVVHHELDATHSAEHGFDPDAHVMPGTLLDHLDESWAVEVFESRDRTTPQPSGGPNVRDVVLRARRRRA